MLADADRAVAEVLAALRDLRLENGPVEVARLKEMVLNWQSSLPQAPPAHCISALRPKAAAQ